MVFDELFEEGYDKADTVLGGYDRISKYIKNDGKADSAANNSDIDNST